MDIHRCRSKWGQERGSVYSSSCPVAAWCFWQELHDIICITSEYLQRVINVDGFFARFSTRSLLFGLFNSLRITGKAFSSVQTEIGALWIFVYLLTYLLHFFARLFACVCLLSFRSKADRDWRRFSDKTGPIQSQLQQHELVASGTVKVSDCEVSRKPDKQIWVFLKCWGKAGSRRSCLHNKKTFEEGRATTMQTYHILLFAIFRLPGCKQSILKNRDQEGEYE